MGFVLSCIRLWEGAECNGAHVTTGRSGRVGGIVQKHRIARARPCWPFWLKRSAHFVLPPTRLVQRMLAAVHFSVRCASVRGGLREQSLGLLRTRVRPQQR